MKFGLKDIRRALVNIVLAVFLPIVLFLVIVNFPGTLGSFFGADSAVLYSRQYSIRNEIVVDVSQVTIIPKPTDCNFFRAPMGDKACHYDRQIHSVLVKTQGQFHYVKYDDNLWQVDDNYPNTQQSVIVGWKKIEEP
jgi:hypothetical protein